MCITEASLIQDKELLQLAQREVPLYILFFIYYTAAQCLLVALPLEDLLLNGSCLGEKSIRDIGLSHPHTEGAGKLKPLKRRGEE